MPGKLPRVPASDLAAMWIPRAPSSAAAARPSQLRVPSARGLPQMRLLAALSPCARRLRLPCAAGPRRHGGRAKHLARSFYDDLGRRGVSAWYEDATAASKCAGGIVLPTGNCHRSVALAAAVQKLLELERPLCLVASQGWRRPVCGPGDFRGCASPARALRPVDGLPSARATRKRMFL